MLEPYQIGQVEITVADLIYAYVPFAEEGQTELRILLQPAWRFKGTTDTNEIIEFVVQAVADEFSEWELSNIYAGRPTPHPSPPPTRGKGSDALSLEGEGWGEGEN